MKNTHNIENLLGHGEWLRKLAISLVRDEARADDLVQETWLAALRGIPEDVRRARAWLATVLRHTAERMGKRDRDRFRGSDEVLDEASTLPEPADMLERVAIQKRLAEEVTALREPYRAAVLWRFFESLPPREIAAREGVPIETVKSRIKRGLVMLRGRLDAELGGSDARRAWLAPLLHVVPGTQSAAQASALSTILGGLVVYAKVWAVIGVAVLAAAFFAWRGTTDDGVRGSTPLDAKSSFEVTETSVSEGDSKQATNVERTSEKTKRASQGDPLEAAAPQLRVQVVDADGSPVAGVPIVIEKPGSHSALWSGKTEGPDGVVTIGAYPDELGINVADGQLAVSANVHTLIPLTQSLVNGEIPRDVVRFELPPTGSMRIRAVNALNLPIRQEADVIMYLTGEERRRLGKRRGPLFLIPNVRFALRDGVVVLPYVEVGQRLEVNLSVQGMKQGWTSNIPVQKVSGPMQAGEQVDVLFALDAPILAGRVLDPAGKPVANRELTGWLMGVRGMATTRARTKMRTDDDGRFSVVVRQKQAGTGERQFVITLNEPDRTGAIEKLPTGPQVRVALPDELTEPMHELGDLTLSQDVRFESEVRDERGLPIEGVEVSLFESTYPRQFAVRKSGLRLAKYDATSDRDGRFSLSTPSGASFLMTLEKEGFVRETLALPRSEQGPIVLVRAASLKARVLVPWSAPQEAISLRYELVRGESAIAANSITNATIDIEACSPGSAALRILTGNRELIAIEGLDLRPGKACRDRRLDPIDLRELIAVRTFRLMKGAAPLAKAWCWANADGVRLQGRTNAEGRVAFLKLDGPFVLETEDHQWVIVEPGAAERVIELKKRYALDIALLSTIEVPMPNYAGIRIVPQLDGPLSEVAEKLAEQLQMDISRRDRAKIRKMPFEGKCRVEYHVGEWKGDSRRVAASEARPAALHTGRRSRVGRSAGSHRRDSELVEAIGSTCLRRS